LADYEKVADETTIWRYMRLGPFLEMLVQGALFQTRVDAFADGSEGAYGYASVKLDPSVVQVLNVSPRRFYDSNGVQHFIPAKNAELIREARRHAVVTCWFKHPGYESYAMWRIYGSDDYAVAIATTVGALRDALQRRGEVRVGEVAYEPLPSVIPDIFTLFFHKRHEYKSEQEIRSIQVSLNPVPEPYQMQSLDPLQLDALLNKIVVAPRMRQTMYDTVLQSIQSRFTALGLTFDPGRMQRSSLEQDLL